MAQLAESTVVVNDPAGRLPRRRTPRRWIDLNTKQRVRALAIALPSFGSTAAFSLDLDHETEAKARVQASAASFLFEAIGRWTFRLLGRRVVLLFELEEATRRHRLHLHGTANVEPHELKLFREALRGAGGEWDKNRQFQAHTKPDPDAGWARYASKQSVWLIKDGPQDEHVGRRIKGEHYAASQKLRGAARALYTEARKAIMGEIPDYEPDDTQVKIDLSSNETPSVAKTPLPSSPSTTHEADAPLKH